MYTVSSNYSENVYPNLENVMRFQSFTANFLGVFYTKERGSLMILSNIYNDQDEFVLAMCLVNYKKICPLQMQNILYNDLIEFGGIVSDDEGYKKIKLIYDIKKSEKIMNEDIKTVAKRVYKMLEHAPISNDNFANDVKMLTMLILDENDENTEKKEG